VPRIVNIHEAKTHLSQLVKDAAEGEEIIIGKAGKPVAKLTAYTGEPRSPGAWKGRVRIADDFDELPRDLEDSFYDAAG